MILQNIIQEKWIPILTALCLLYRKPLILPYVTAILQACWWNVNSSWGNAEKFWKNSVIFFAPCIHWRQKRNRSRLNQGKSGWLFECVGLSVLDFPTFSIPLEASDQGVSEALWFWTVWRIEGPTQRLRIERYWGKCHEKLAFGWLPLIDCVDEDKTLCQLQYINSVTRINELECFSELLLNWVEMRCRLALGDLGELHRIHEHCQDLVPKAGAIIHAQMSFIGESWAVLFWCYFSCMLLPPPVLTQVFRLETIPGETDSCSTLPNFKAIRTLVILEPKEHYYTARVVYH